MQPLIEVAIEIQADYQRLRAAAIRGEVRSQRVKNRWWIDRDDALRWKRELTPQPQPAA